MEYLNEGKKKASSYMNELAEIDKQSALVALEAKINKLAEMIETKNTRINLVSEDENLSELIDKKRVKEMQREIKEIERAKLKLEKLFEKQGGKMTGVIDETEEVVDEDSNAESNYDSNDGSNENSNDNPAANSSYSGLEKFKEDVDEGGGNIDSNQEPKSFLKKTPYSAMEEDSDSTYEEDEVNEEFNLRGYLAENRLLK